MTEDQKIDVLASLLKIDRHLFEAGLSVEGRQKALLSAIAPLPNEEYRAIGMRLNELMKHVDSLQEQPSEHRYQLRTDPLEIVESINLVGSDRSRRDSLIRAVDNRLHPHDRMLSNEELHRIYQRDYEAAYARQQARLNSVPNDPT